MSAPREQPRPTMERSDAAGSDALATNGVLDVRALPSFGFSHRSIMWWGTAGLMAIESTVFALAVMAYFYLRSLANRWPMSTPPPELLWGTFNTVLFIVSAWPNQLAKRAGERLDRAAVQLWLTVMLALSLLILVVRGLELTALNVRWDSDAYGSVVWFLMGLHTMHLATDAWDTGVLDVLFFTGPLEGKRYVDVSENAMYWDFVVLSWLPIYAVLYLAPRG
jgi:heme/copper-type cytochrome/quinol oxidase subunit 3